MHEHVEWGADIAHGGKVNITTVDWCDPTTWYQAAVRVNEIAIPQNAIPVLKTATRWKLARGNVIDVTHGKLVGEDALRDLAGHPYALRVTVDGVEVAEGPKLAVDYRTGVLTFASGVSTATPPSVTYHSAQSSVTTIKPAPGKVLHIHRIAVMLSRDFGMADTLHLAIFGPVERFAPGRLAQLAAPDDVPGGALPIGTMIPVAPPRVYKTVRDLLCDAVGSVTLIPAQGGAGWRGLAQDTQILHGQPLTPSPLYSSLGMEARIWLEHDTSFTGDGASATFYCTSEDE